jgi:hypothetical protein
VSADPDPDPLAVKVFSWSADMPSREGPEALAFVAALALAREDGESHDLDRSRREKISERGGLVGFEVGGRPSGSVNGVSDSPSGLTAMAGPRVDSRGLGMNDDQETAVLGTVE